MGSTKIGTSNSAGDQQSQTKYTPTPEQTELDKLSLEQARATQGGQIQLQQSGLDLTNKLLQGQALPGYLQSLPGGIDQATVDRISQQSIKDIQPYFQKSGLLDSGVNASISARTSADVQNQAAQFNVNNLLQLLNLGVGGQAQVQAPISSGSQALGSRLSALAGTNTTGSFNSSGSQFGNPFMSSFMSQLGARAGGAWK